MVYSIADQLECVRRELKMRRRVYPRWVEQGKMSSEFAHAQIATMQEVEHTLEGLLPKEPDLFAGDDHAADQVEE